jgi:hypothetical protein
VRYLLDSSTCNGRPTLAVVVTNDGNEVAPGIGVDWEAVYDTPQPASAEWPMLGGQETGQGAGFITRDGEPRADIPPGGRVVYYLHPDSLDAMVLSHIAALSPDRYAVVVRSGRVELERYLGTEFAHLLPPVEGGASR